MSMNTTREKKKTTIKITLDAKKTQESVILCFKSLHLKFMQKFDVSDTKLPQESATGNCPDTNTSNAPSTPTMW